MKVNTIVLSVAELVYHSRVPPGEPPVSENHPPLFTSTHTTFATFAGRWRRFQMVASGRCSRAEVTIPAKFCRCDASEPPGRSRLYHGRAAGRPARWLASTGGRWHHRGAGVLWQPRKEAGRSADLPRAARAARAVASAGWRCGTTPVPPIYSDFFVLLVRSPQNGAGLPCCFAGRAKVSMQ